MQLEFLKLHIGNIQRSSKMTFNVKSWRGLQFIIILVRSGTWQGTREKTNREKSPRNMGSQPCFLNSPSTGILTKIYTLLHLINAT